VCHFHLATDFEGDVLVLERRSRFDLTLSRPNRELQNRSPLMNLRKIVVVSAVLLSLVLTSCGSTRRVSKDVSMVAMSPLVVPYGGFTDGYVAATELAAGLDGGSATEFMAMPFTVSYHLLKHLFYAGHHFVDIFAFPVYGAAELHPKGPEIQPLDYYSGTIFDEVPEASGTDAETGESVGR